MTRERLLNMAAEAYGIAAAHGWYDEEPMDGDVQCNLASELIEAWDEYAHNHGIAEVYLTRGADGRDKENGVPVELADYVIRVLNAAAHWKMTERADMVDSALIAGSRIVEEQTSVLCGMEQIALSTLLVSMLGMIVCVDSREMLAFNAIASIQYIESWCKAHDVDLFFTVRRKMEYNKTRTYRHGGKRV